MPDLDMAIHCFQSPDLESFADISSSQGKSDIIARNLLKFLILGQYNSLWLTAQSLLNFTLVRALFFKHDPELLAALRHESQAAILSLYDYIGSESFVVDRAAQQHIELNLAYILSVYALFEPSGDDGPLQVPRYIAGRYQLIDYELTPLELLPKDELGYSADHHRDKVYAYGYSALNHEQAKCLLFFKGTTFPAGQGFRVQELINMYPYTSVGEMYHWDNVDKWVSAHESDKTIHVYGASQGGSMALLFALRHPAKASRVNAMNPPGMLQDYSASHDEFGAWERQRLSDPNKLPKVVVLSQAGDPVSPLGLWKADWKVVRVKLGDESSIPVLRNHLAHITNYLGQGGTIVSKLSGDDENTFGRELRTTLILYYARIAIHYERKLLNHFLSPMIRYASSWIEWSGLDRRATEISQVLIYRYLQENRNPAQDDHDESLGQKSNELKVSPG